MEKPKNVTIAVNCLWATLALGLVRLCWMASQSAAQESLGIVIAVGVGTMAVVALLIWQISAGKNWARLIFLLLFLFGLPASVPTMITYLNSYPLNGASMVLQTSLQIYACFLIFTEPGGSWYRKKDREPSAS